MSEVITDKLTGRATANDVTVTVGATATQSLEQGLVKAWGGDITDSAVAGDSFNISSIDDTGTGANRVHWSSVFNNSDYSIVGSNVHSSATNRLVGFGALTTSKAELQSFVASTAAVSSVAQTLNCTGDLA